MKHIPRILLAMGQSRAFGRGQVRGISKYARIHGPWMFLTKQESYHGGSDFPVLKKGVIDGAIIREPRQRELKKFIDLGIPLIVSNHWTPNPPCSHITSDCETIGQMGATHFLNCGFRRFAFCSPGELFWSKRRCQSFVEAVAKAGFGTHVYKPPARKDDRVWHREQRILADWLASLPKPLGLMACTDDRAFELVEACEVAGIKVPEEVAILGVDDDDLVCEMATVPISSVALDLEQAGYEAARLLHRLMKGQIVDRQEIL
ncbi:MAG: XylR family transcriptional regulator, partial [Verrucomicrobia bacterium]|nr:XylR family transcriptional regulator [Verrucomicrobiota bacterium]